MTDTTQKERFHRRVLENKAGLFAIVTTIAISIGGIVEIVPMFTQAAGPEKPDWVSPYTPLEVAGRDIYIREGCYNCHSQLVRPFRFETERYGEYSKAGEYVYDRPFQWGSKRTGPDLHRVGGKYPSLWHVRHMRQPDSTTPGSIMPQYAHLLTSRYDTSLIGSKLGALRTLGVPYSDGEIETAAAAMESQARAIAADVEAQKGPTGLADREIVALTAYLQRLGTDIRWKKAAVAPASGAMAGQAPAVAPASAAPGTPAGASASAPSGASADKSAGQAPAVR